jgi:hypothetical protein
MSNLLTIKQFAQRHPAFSAPALRNMRFHQDKNGFAPAFKTVGAKVLIDEAEFFRVIERQNRRVA